MRIAISEIKVNPGRREVDQENIKKLADSIRDLGLLHPIIIDKKYTLIAGLHRIEAVKLLEWTEIECTISSLEGLKAELAEIDENVIRSDISAVDFGDLLLRRKKIYETLHPEVKATYNGGGFKGNQHMDQVTDNLTVTTKSFVQDTAAKLGVTPRTVERQIQTARNMTQEAKDILRDTGKRFGKQTALKLSRLVPEQQQEAASMLASGEIHSVEQYNALKLHQRNEKTDMPEHKSESSVQEIQSHIDLVEKSSDDSEQESEQYARNFQTPVEHTNTESKTLNQELQALSEQLGGDSDNAEQFSETTDADVHASELQSSEQSSVPYRLPDKQFNSFKESIADLKDPNKDCSCTPDIFLAEYSRFIRRFINDIRWYTTPQYEVVFPALTQSQIDYLRVQTKSVCDSVQNLLKQVERMNNST